MPLTTCPDCGRQISTAAEACPQCGRPNDVVTRAIPAGSELGELRCYHCERSATTRCVRCGVMSCAEHLQPIRIGKRGHELRCETCYQSAVDGKMIGCVVAVIILVVFFLFVAGVMSQVAQPGFPH